MPRSTYRRLASAVALSLASLHLAAQQASFATTMPVPRPDENSAIAHADLVHKAGSGVIDVYLIGDSITRRWGALDSPELLAHFEATFFGWNAANFAWGDADADSPNRVGLHVIPASHSSCEDFRAFSLVSCLW
jgi:hypothetical protein